MPLTHIIHKEKIHAKGKGEMQTYWLVVRSANSLLASGAGGERRSSGDTGISEIEFNYDGVSIDEVDSVVLAAVPDWDDGDDLSLEEPKALLLGDRMQRLVDWNVDQLATLLRKIVADRRDKLDSEEEDLDNQSKPNGADFDLRTDSSILQEVTEVISFPKPSIADLVVGVASNNHENVELDPAVISQLRQFMTKIASMYNDNNPFHNFAHASHVSFCTCVCLMTVVSNPT
jgi:hypothetical protein